MTNTLLILVSVLTFAANGLSTRGFQLHCARSNRDTCLYQTMYCLVGAIAYFVQAGFRFTLNPLQLICAVAFGVFFASASLASAACYLCGPMSLTSVITNSSVVLPILYSCITLHESVTVPQFIGCLLLLLTFALSAILNDSPGTHKRVNLRWLLFVLLSFASNGITAILQKQYKLAAPVGDGYDFMGVAYLTSAVVMFVAALCNKRPDNAAGKVRAPVLWGVFVLLAGLGSFVGNGVLLQLSTQVPASLLYPFVNGGLCVTISIFSMLLFREKFTVRKAIVIAVGLASVIVLNL